MCSLLKCLLSADPCSNTPAVPSVSSNPAYGSTAVLSVSSNPAYGSATAESDVSAYDEDGYIDTGPPTGKTLGISRFVVQLVVHMHIYIQYRILIALCSSDHVKKTLIVAINLLLI